MQPGSGRPVTEAGVLQQLQAARAELRAWADCKWWQWRKKRQHVISVWHLIGQAQADLAMLYREHRLRAPDCVRGVNLEVPHEGI